MPATASDYDGAWKDALDSYFPQFLALFWPALHAQIDWAHKPVFLDKELQAIRRSAKRGRRHVDKLVSLRLLAGQKALVLIHIEVQAKPDKGLAPTNPFAVVILAQLDANATHHGPARLAHKTELARGLYLWGFSRDNVAKLFRIIDVMVGLPEELEPAFEQAIHQLEEETHMTYITSIERVRIKRAQQETKQARQEGEQARLEGISGLLATLLVRRFGQIPEWARVRLAQADEATLNGWAVQVLDAQRIEDVFA